MERTSGNIDLRNLSEEYQKTLEELQEIRIKHVRNGVNNNMPT